MCRISFCKLAKPVFSSGLYSNSLDDTFFNFNQVYPVIFWKNINKIFHGLLNWWQYKSFKNWPPTEVEIHYIAAKSQFHFLYCSLYWCLLISSLHNVYKFEKLFSFKDCKIIYFLVYMCSWNIFVPRNISDNALYSFTSGFLPLHEKWQSFFFFFFLSCSTKQNIIANKKFKHEHQNLPNKFEPLQTFTATTSQVTSMKLN